MSRNRTCAVAVFVWATVAHGQAPTLSQYAPLSVSRSSTYFESPTESEIRRLLRAQPFFGVFDHIAYRVDGGIVTLSGEVMHPELRSSAQVVVSTIQGVMYVNNQIRLLTVSPPENQIRKDVFVAIYADPWLRPYSLASGGAIHIVVQGDRVTLEGEVSSGPDRQRAADLAKATRGVSAVVNHLTVSN